MTVETTGVRLAFVGNGVTTSFPCTGVPARAASDYVVELQTGSGEPVAQILGSHYTVAGTFPGVGTILMFTAPATGQTLWVRRQTPSTQQLDLKPANPLSAEAMERALDRLSKRVQELEELFRGVPKTPYHLWLPGSDPGTRLPLAQTGHLLIGQTGVGWTSQEATAFLAGLGIVPGGGGGGSLSWPLLAPAGDPSAPSYSWAGHSSTGFWRDGAVIKVSIAGDDEVELSASPKFGLRGLELGLLNVDTNDRTDGALTVYEDPSGSVVAQMSGAPQHLDLIPGPSGRVHLAGVGPLGADLTAAPYRLRDGGDLAAAIASAVADGHRALLVPPGEYVWNSAVTVPDRVQIVGAGARVTKVSVASSISGAFLTFDLNTSTSFDTDWSKAGISGFLFQVGGASGILVKGHEILVDDIHFHGGASGGWAIDLLNCNEFVVSRVNIGKGGGAFDWLGSGIRVRLDRGTPLGAAVNFGDGVIRDSVIKLKSTNQIGISLDGSGFVPTSGAAKPVINNVIVTGVHVNSGNKPAGSIGIKLRQVQRCAFVNVDVERLTYGWHLSSPFVNGNPGSNQYNSYFGCYTLNCDYEWADFGDTLDGGSQPASQLRSWFLGTFFTGPRGSDATPDYGFALGDEGGTFSAKGSPVDAVLGGTLWFTLPSTGQMQGGFRHSQQGRMLYIGDINYSPNPGTLPYDGAFKNDKPRKALGFDCGINEVRIYKPWGTAEGTDARITIGNGPTTTGLSGTGSPATPLHHIKLSDPVYLERWNVALPSGGSVPGYGSNVPDVLVNAADTTPLGTLQDWQGPGIYSRTEEPGGSWRWVRAAARPGFVKAQLARSATSYVLSRDDAGKFAEYTPGSGSATITINADLIAANEQTNAAGYSTAFTCWIKNRSGAGHNVTLSTGTGVSMFSTTGTSSISSYTLTPGQAVQLVYVRTGAGTASVYLLPAA